MVKKKICFPVFTKITLSAHELPFDFTVKNACMDILSMHF